MAFNTITDGESGLSVRTSLNQVVAYLNGLGWQPQFSNDATNWHYPFQSGDVYIRYSADFGVTYSPAFFIGITVGDLSNFVEKQTGYRLASEQELSAIRQYVYTIVLPAAATVAGRLIAVIEKPVDWTLAAGSNPADLKITHNLDRRIASVTIFSVDGTSERQLFGNAAYSGILATTQDELIIEALATIETEIVIQLIFAV